MVEFKALEFRVTVLYFELTSSQCDKKLMYLPLRESPRASSSGFLYKAHTKLV